VRRFGSLGIREAVLLALPSGRSPPQGALLSLVATVQPPRGPKDGFDERTWLRRHGVHVVLHADRWCVVGRRGGAVGLADRLREFVARPLTGARGEAGDVLAGVVLGEDQCLSEELRERFRASGLYHLLAVSGETGTHGPTGAQDRSRGPERFARRRTSLDAGRVTCRRRTATIQRCSQTLPFPSTSPRPPSSP
jgi:Competence protein